MRRSIKSEDYNPFINKKSEWQKRRNIRERITSLKEQPCIKCLEISRSLGTVINNNGIGREKDVINYHGDKIIVCLQHKIYYSYQKNRNKLNIFYT
ncbi:MAG: hypothetical protein EAX96_06580 [Candidatus Lokiarchaeota archaeon]|nr:hypothetical protein [Candidatus Lokiarchaeota archaeon]